MASRLSEYIVKNVDKCINNDDEVKLFKKITELKPDSVIRQFFEIADLSNFEIFLDFITENFSRFVRYTCPKCKNRYSYSSNKGALKWHEIDIRYNTEMIFMRIIPYKKFPCCGKQNVLNKGK